MSAELPWWCDEHRRLIGPDGRCEWDVEIEARLDGSREALLAEREVVERRMWNDSLRLLQIRHQLDELTRREAA